MQLSNLIFFDKFGENYNFQMTKFNQETQSSDSLTWWYGREYIDPISIGLYDSRQIFVIENLSGSYKFPTLSQNQRIVFKWETTDITNEDPFFLYLVKHDITGNSEVDTPYIERVNQITINHSDYSNGSSGSLDISLPLQVNIAFSPIEEKIYQWFHQNASKVNVIDKQDPVEEKVFKWMHQNNSANSNLDSTHHTSEDVAISNVKTGRESCLTDSDKDFVVEKMVYEFVVGAMKTCHTIMSLAADIIASH